MSFLIISGWFNRKILVVKKKIKGDKIRFPIPFSQSTSRGFLFSFRPVKRKLETSSASPPIHLLQGIIEANDSLLSMVGNETLLRLKIEALKTEHRTQTKHEATVSCFLL